MNTSRISITLAAESLAAFLQSNVPDGTGIIISPTLAGQLTNSARSLVALATEQGVDIEVERQAYEAVGWLCVQVESWLHDSPLEDELLERWALTLLA